MIVIVVLFITINLVAADHQQAGVASLEQELEARRVWRVVERRPQHTGGRIELLDRRGRAAEGQRGQQAVGLVLVVHHHRRLARGALRVRQAVEHELAQQEFEGRPRLAMGTVIQMRRLLLYFVGDYPYKI